MAVGSPLPERRSHTNGIHLPHRRSAGDGTAINRLAISPHSHRHHLQEDVRERREDRTGGGGRRGEETGEGGGERRGQGEGERGGERREEVRSAESRGEEWAERRAEEERERSKEKGKVVKG